MADQEIRILSQIEAVRKNPWMYIGSVSADGVHQLVQELVHNSVDEALLGHARHIGIKIGAGFAEVSDDGRGIPTEPHATERVSSCEVALTRLHAGSKFDKQPGDFTAGLHGVGLSCVNALSSHLKVKVERGGSCFEQEYNKGQPEAELRLVGPTNRSGTTIRFSPDSSIFPTFRGFDETRCLALLQELSFLIQDLELTFENELTARKETFRTSAGMAGLLREKLADHRPLFADPIQVTLNAEGLSLDARLLWTAETDQCFHSYVNCVATVHGGTHVNALRSGVARAVRHLISEIGKNSWQGALPEADEVGEGLFGAIAIKLSHPNFEGQTKSRLTNDGIIAQIEDSTARQVGDYFRVHPREAALVFERLVEVRKGRLTSKRVADRIFLQHSKREINEEVYKEQFGARSRNWHDSATWITHKELLASHAAHYTGSAEGIGLDVCCGSGVVGASFKPRLKKMYGLDLTPEMVSLAETRLDEVRQGNVYKIPFPSEMFDLVCTREVLHLLPNPERPVAEIFRVLKPGAQFIVGQILPFSEADAPWLYRVFKKKQPLFFNLHQEEDFRRMLLSAGFEQIEMTEMTVWESIDRWIDSYETSAAHRHEIRDLYRNAPLEARAVHPIKILPSGEIQDLWRWCVFSGKKPG